MRSWLRLILMRVERVAFVQSEFAADDLVARDGIALDVDPLDVGALRLAHFDRDVHHLLFGVASVARIDVGEGIALDARDFAQPGYNVLDPLGVEPVAWFDRPTAMICSEVKSRSSLCASTVPNL